MILAEKILTLRKKSGWSQEELAERLDVSRQSISKWESAASIPDINKIIEMGKLFGVTTDYLLKDEMEATEYTQDDEGSRRKVSLEEANAFINGRKVQGRKIGIGAVLCILSPITLILLSGLCETMKMMSEGMAVGIGLTTLLLMVSAAVSIFIVSGFKMKKYEYLENETFELEYGVSGVIKEKLVKYEPQYMIYTVIAVVICIIGVLPLIISAVMGAADMVVLIMVGVLLAVVSCAVYVFIATGTYKSSFDRLLGEGDYNKSEIKKNRVVNKISGIYWPAVTAGFLLWSFISNSWNISWIIWPVAALVFSGIAVVFRKDE